MLPLSFTALLAGTRFGAPTISEGGPFPPARDIVGPCLISGRDQRKRTAGTRMVGALIAGMLTFGVLTLTVGVFTLTVGVFTLTVGV